MSSIAQKLRQLIPVGQRPVVSIGNFDGVHQGHQAVFSEVTASAQRHQAPSVALTFDPHPVVYFGKRDPATFLLTSLQTRLDLIRAHGVDHPIALDFTPSLFNMSPEAFVHEILYEGLNAREVWVGYDFNYGKGRAGGVEDLKRDGAARGIDVHIHSAVGHDEAVISSTRVRKALAAGALDEAQTLLGRPHTLVGEVLHGHKRGRTLGTPTANQRPTAGMMIPYGVYITTASLPGRSPLPAVTHVGVRPTIADDLAPNAETFILSGLGQETDLYGQQMEVALHQHLREELKLDSMEALKAQMDDDIARARAFHGLDA